VHDSSAHTTFSTRALSKLIFPRPFFTALSIITRMRPLNACELSVSESGADARAILTLNPPTRCGLALLLSQMKCAIIPCGKPNRDMPNRDMKETDVRQGTLALMVLKTLDVLGPLHGYGIARRIEQISGDILTVNQGTLYPVLLRLEQEGSIASEWGVSENNRRARFYRLTRDGRKQLRAETLAWEQTAAIIGRFFEVKAEDLK
jgi:PadR family transcriptional regulator, regulatory protein PadR